MTLTTQYNHISLALKTYRTFDDRWTFATESKLLVRTIWA